MVYEGMEFVVTPLKGWDGLVRYFYSVKGGEGVDLRKKDEFGAVGEVVLMRKQYAVTSFEGHDLTTRLYYLATTERLRPDQPPPSPGSSVNRKWESMYGVLKLEQHRRSKCLPRPNVSPMGGLWRCREIYQEPDAGTQDCNPGLERHPVKEAANTVGGRKPSASGRDLATISARIPHGPLDLRRFCNNAAGRSQRLPHPDTPYPYPGVPFVRNWELATRAGSAARDSSHPKRAG